MHHCIEAVRNANVTLQRLSLQDSGDNELGNRPLMGEVNSHNSRDILSHWLNIYNIVSLPYSQPPPPPSSSQDVVKAGCCNYGLFVLSKYFQ